MAHPYRVDLTEEERGDLLDVLHKGKTTARRVARAHVLRRAAEGAADADMAHPLPLGIASVHRIRQRLVAEGLTAALRERPRGGSPPALTGQQAAFWVALAGTTPPVGRYQWTLQLLADRFIERRPIDTLSADTVRRVLKKTISHLGSAKKGAFRGSVRTRFGIGKTSWIWMRNPMIPAIPPGALTKAPSS